VTTPTESAARRLLRVSQAEWQYSMAAVPLLLAVRVALAVRPALVVHRRLARNRSRHSAPHVHPVLICRAVNRLAFRAPWLFGECLHRSLAAWWLLRRAGYDPVLQLGVRPNGERMDFHAWLEIDGVVVNDRPHVAQWWLPIPHERLDEVARRR
jgi:hypothetical protein